MAEGLSIRLRQDKPIPLDIDLEVPPGRTLALVGASGAGKSTMLRSIAGLYRPGEGRIACNGELWMDSSRSIHLPAQARRVGLVFQAYALFPHLSALENVMEAMLDRPRGERRRGAAELLERVHLDGLGGRLPSALSGGQQQRVALARALARDPEVLLLDEPFSAVDHPTRRALHGLLAEIRASTDMPIIFVSHDVEDAARSADHCAFLQAGAVVEAGRTKETLENPGSNLARWLQL